MSGVVALARLGSRSERTVASAIGLLVLIVATGVASAPRLLEREESASLAQAIADAPAAQRRLAVRAVDLFAAGEAADPLAAQRAEVDDAAATLPRVVDERYGPPRLVVDTSRFVVVDVGGVAPPSPTTLTLRVHPELDDHSRLVDGRAARPTAEVVDDRRVLEFEASTVTAEVMGWELGTELALDADTSDTVTRRYSGGLPDTWVARLVGLRELDAPTDPYWSADSRLHRPVVADTGVGASFSVLGAVPAAALPDRPFLVDGRSPLFVELRRDLLADSITLNDVGELLDGLVALDAASAELPAPGQPGVVAGLRRVLEREADQRVVARSTALLAAAGVVGVALVTVGQAVRSGFARRRGWLTVARARGASPGQVIVTTAAEIGVVAGVAVLVGASIGAVAFGGAPSVAELWLHAVTWLGAVGTVLVAAVAETRRPVDASGRSSVAAGVDRWARIVTVVVLVVCVAAVVTFRRRGIAAEVVGVDALVVAVPLLVPIGVVMATRWLLPRLLRSVSRIGMRLGPGRLVGLRRAIDDPAAGTGLVAVLALALTVTGLGLGVARSLDQGIVDASWAEVGGELRVDTRDPEVIAAVRSLPGTEVAALGDNLQRLDRDGETFNARLINVETAAVDAATAGTGADLRLPDDFAEIDEGRLPAVVSERLGGVRMRVGDVFGGTGSVDDVEFVVVEVRSEFGGRSLDWVVVDRSAHDALAARPAATSTLLVDVDDVSRPAFDSLAAAAGIDVVDRAAIERQQRDDPLVRAVRRGYVGAGVAALLFALLGVAGSAVVTARQRRREVAVLGLLGAGRRELARSVRTELLPSTIAGIAIGTLLGLVVTDMFDGRFDLSPFADGVPVPIRADAFALCVAAALTLASSLAVTAALVRSIVHVRVHDVLRIEGAA